MHAANAAAADVAQSPAMLFWLWDAICGEHLSDN